MNSMCDNSETPSVGELFNALGDVLRIECVKTYGHRLVSIAVFGSVGRRTARQDSDVDFILVADELPKGRLKRIAEFAAVESAVNRWLRTNWISHHLPELSPIIKLPDEIIAGSPLLLDMTQDARILYDRDAFLEKRLMALSDRLRELGARRIVNGNAWWWDLKPDYRHGEVFSL